MKNLPDFQRLGTCGLIAAAFLAILLAGPSSQTLAASSPNEMSASSQMQAADPSTATQVTNQSRQEQFAAMEKGAAETAEKSSGNPAGDKTPCPDSPPGACYSVGVTQGNQWNCSAGSACSVEGGSCGLGQTKHCTTTPSGGTCYCSCM
jgi:hypothetical protein